jgi:hypothetical protein
MLAACPPLGTFATWQGTQPKAALGSGTDIIARFRLSLSMSSRPSLVKPLRVAGGGSVGLRSGTNQKTRAPPDQTRSSQ